MTAFLKVFTTLMSVISQLGILLVWWWIVHAQRKLIERYQEQIEHNNTLLKSVVDAYKTQETAYNDNTDVLNEYLHEVHPKMLLSLEVDVNS